MSDCDQVRELLAAFADGGLEGAERADVARHVEGCAACRAEVGELRQTLADARGGAAAGAEAKDERFWRDFGRETRLAYERAKERESSTIWGWLRGGGWKPAAVMGAAAVAIVVVLAVVGGGGKAPQRAHNQMLPDAGVPADVGDGEETLGVTGWAEGVDDMSEEQLDLVLSDLGDDDEAEENVDDEDADGEPLEAIEELDDDEIERVLDALTKGV